MSDQGSVWTSWNLDPAVLLGTAAAGWWYARGLRGLRQRSSGRGVRWWQVAAFGAGLLSLLVALVSPLDEAASRSLAAHMIQHLALIVVAAPLLVAGAPAVPLFSALPRSWRRWLRRTGSVAPLPAVRRAFTQPVSVWVFHVAAVWAWHVPALYQRALANAWIHALEHASFFGTALLFWWVLAPPAGHRRLARGHDIVYVFGAGVQGGALGALFTFASSPLYPFYTRGPGLWGLTPIQDQQLAGLIMWIPAGLVYLAGAAVLFVTWLSTLEREQRRAEERDRRRAEKGDRRVAHDHAAEAAEVQ